MFFTPEVETLEGWDNWEQRMRSAHPIQFWVRHTIPRLIRRSWRVAVHESLYYLRCLVFHRYNVVKVRRLPPTWNDRSELLFHACFQILVDFMEREEPLEHFNIPVSQHQEAWADICECYSWYTSRDVIDEESPEAQAMLEKLVRRRNHFWT